MSLFWLIQQNNYNYFLIYFSLASASWCYFPPSNWKPREGLCGPPCCTGSTPPAQLFHTPHLHASGEMHAGRASPRAPHWGLPGCFLPYPTSTALVVLTLISHDPALFVLLSHLYLFKRPDKANTCDALFILWLSLEHIKLIITSYKLEIGIFSLASVDSK